MNICKVTEINGIKYQQSSFSGLPDEMIEHIFSFLPMKDRLRARVDKRTRRYTFSPYIFIISGLKMIITDEWVNLNLRTWITAQITVNLAVI